MRGNEAACHRPALSPSLLTYLLLLLTLPHGSIVFLLVKNLLHFAVLQVVKLAHSILGPLDEVNQDARRAFPSHKVMLDIEERINLVQK